MNEEKDIIDRTIGCKHIQLKIEKRIKMKNEKYKIELILINNLEYPEGEYGKHEVKIEVMEPFIQIDGKLFKEKKKAKNYYEEIKNKARRTIKNE